MPKAQHVVDESQAVLHLEALFGYAVEDGYAFVGFTLPDRSARTFDSIQKAAKWLCAAARKGRDAYVSMAIVHPEFDAGRGRNDASDAVGLVCAWSDIDVRGDAHASDKAYPPDFEEALAVGRVVGHMEESLAVDSGYGLHTYWLFKEPWIFESPEEARDARVFVERFGATIQSRARSRGWAVDSVYDLARVMRVAGTVNAKKDPSVPVKIVRGAEGTTKRYDPSEIEPFLVAAEMHRPTAAVTESIEALDLAPDAYVDSQLLKMMFENHPEFEDIWAERRDDLRDGSASGYDMSLANFLVGVGWEDQRIVDAMIHWRRERGHPPKLRQDYYQRTLGKARQLHRQKRVVADIESGVSEGPRTGDHMTSDERSRTLEELRALLGITIVRFVQLDIDEARFFVLLEDGTEFTVGGVGDVTRFSKFRDRLVERCGVVLPPKLGKSWHQVVERLFAVVTREDSDEPTTADRTRSMLARYLHDSTVYGEDWHKAGRDRSPFVRDGRVYVMPDHLLRWMKVHTTDRLSGKGVRAELRAVGMVPEQISFQLVRGTRRRISYWGCALDDLDHVDAQSLGVREPRE